MGNPAVAVVAASEDGQEQAPRAKVFALLDAAYDVHAWLTLWSGADDVGAYVMEWYALHVDERPLSLEHRFVDYDGRRGRVLSIQRGKATFVDVYYPSAPITLPTARREIR